MKGYRKIRLWLMVFLLSGSPLNVIAGDNVWTSIGPYGGEIYGLAVDQINANIAYIATDAGLFKTTDCGEHWVYSSEGIDFSHGALAVAIDPGEHNHIYLSMGRLGLYHSQDAARTWEKIDATGLLENPYPYVNALAISPSNPEVIYNTPKSNSIIAVYVSTDLGVTWAAKTNGFPSPLPLHFYSFSALAVNPVNSVCAYAGLGSWASGLYYTNDLGETWSLVAGGLPSTITPTAIAFEYGNPSTIYVGTYYAGVYLSTDSGGTWTGCATGDLLTALPGSIDAILSHPASPTTIYAAKNTFLKPGEIFKKTAVTDWQKIAGGIKATYLGASPLAPSVIYAGGWIVEGLYISSDAGNTWPKKVIGITAVESSTIAIAQTNAEYLYTSMWGNHLMRSQDCGLHWEEAGTGLAFTVSAIAVNIAKPRDIFVGAGADKGIYFSSDYGHTWNKKDNYQYNGLIRAIKIAPSNSNVIYAAVGEARIFRSPDYGDSWQDISSGFPPEYSIKDMDVDPIDENIVYLAYKDDTAPAIDPDGGAYKKNGDNDWQNICSLTQRPAYCIKVNPYQRNIIYLGTSHGVYCSRDSGAHWDSYCDGYVNNLLVVTSMVVVPPLEQQPEALMVSTLSRSVSRTLDQGVSWHVWNSGLPQSPCFTDMVIDIDRLTLYATTMNYGVYAYTFDLISPTPTPIPTALSTLEKSDKVVAYPNPARGDWVTFAYYVEEDCKIIINIYDVGGQRITTLSENKCGGTNAITLWDISQIPAGIYFYRLEINGTSSTIKKLAIVK